MYVENKNLSLDTNPKGEFFYNQFYTILLILLMDRKHIFSGHNKLL